MSFRHFVQADRAALKALWEACDLTRPWNPADADIDAFTAHPEATILVSGDPVQASVAVGHDGHRGWLYYVSVDPARQGTGLGRAAIAAGEAWLAARGAVKVHLMVRETNPVLGFYEGLGYADSEVRVMAKWLDPERARLAGGGA